jgi:hypothetical protein
MAQSTPDSKLRDADLKAGDAVAAGALVAGPLLKRSDWLHSWNKRFAILTPEELAWQREPGAEWRSVTLLSEVRTFVRDNGLTLIVQPADASSAQLCFRAASEPELLMWHSQIRSLLEALQAEGRVAFLHMRESSAYVSRPYEEIPHIGSRNHRERALTKLYYTCQKRTLVGQPQQPIEGSEVCMYLMALPALSSSWSGQQRRAFRELLDAITAANHPFLLGVLRADILPDVLRAAVYRPLLARGSLCYQIPSIGPRGRGAWAERAAWLAAVRGWHPQAISKAALLPFNFFASPARSTLREAGVGGDLLPALDRAALRACALWQRPHLAPWQLSSHGV